MYDFAIKHGGRYVYGRIVSHLLRYGVLQVRLSLSPLCEERTMVGIGNKALTDAKRSRTYALNMAKSWLRRFGLPQLKQVLTEFQGVMLKTQRSYRKAKKALQQPIRRRRLHKRRR